VHRANHAAIYGMQQKVVGVFGVAAPVGAPPEAAQLPPLGAVMPLASRDATVGLPVRSAQPPVVTDATGPVHVLIVFEE
jgi:hypothetical protein